MNKIKKISLIVLVLGLLFISSFKTYASQLPQSPAIFETSLAFPIATTDTSMNLASNILLGGATLPSGFTCFTLDQGQPNTEYTCGTVSGTSVTSLTRGIDPVTGYTSDANLIFSHRRGADIKITDFPVLTLLRNILNGTDTIANIISYTTHPTFSSNTQIVDKKYVDDIAIAGGANASSTVKGISKLSVDPVSPTNPIAVGDNDTRVPTINTSSLTTGELQALVGQSGTAPSSSNKFEDNADTSATSANNKLVRANGSGLIDSSFLPSFTATAFTAGASITSGQPVTLGYYQSDGGVLFDAKAYHNTSVSSSGGNDTISFTVGNNSNRAMVVFVNVGSASGTVPTPTVTYNGVSMTAVETQTVSSSQKLFSFILTSPATGANNLVVTLGSSSQTNYVSTGIISYYNTSGMDTHTGAASNTVAYGVPPLGSLLVSGAGGGTASTSSANNFNNLQNSPTNSYTQIATADSGQAFTSSSATVTYGSSPTSITVIGLKAFTTPVGGYVYPSSSASVTNGVNQNKYTSFVGFANSSVGAGSSVSVSVNGVISGLTSLTPNSPYYLNDSSGTIGTSAGTNTRKVGIATSTTSLLITNIW